MRCWLLLPMFAVSACLSRGLNRRRRVQCTLSAMRGVIRCSLRQMSLAFCSTSIRKSVHDRLYFSKHQLKSTNPIKVQIKAKKRIYEHNMHMYASQNKLRPREMETTGQSNLAKAASNSRGNRDSHLAQCYDVALRTESALHVLSARSSPCTVSANATSTLALVCSTQLMTSSKLDERTCAVRWQRLLRSGRYSNVTSLSGKYSVWQMDRASSSSSDERSVVNVLQIAALQPDDFTRST